MVYVAKNLVADYFNISSTDYIRLYVAIVNLEDLVPLEFPLDALGKLDLPDKQKEVLVKAIDAVQAHKQQQQVAKVVSQMVSRSKITDRLFLLFYGPSGAGKSFAAQCLADHVRRPLFLITSGVKAGEATFIDCVRTVFKFAVRWDCLVLMDHVDTVVGARSTPDLESNVVLNGRLWQAREQKLEC